MRRWKIVTIVDNATQINENESVPINYVRNFKIRFVPQKNERNAKSISVSLR